MTSASVRPRSRRRKLIVLSLATLVWLALAEGAYRVYWMAAGQPYGRDRAEARLDALIAEMHDRQFVPKDDQSDLTKEGMIIHPYQGFQIAELTEKARIQARYFASSRAQANFDIVLIGGSVAAEFGNWARLYFLPDVQKDPRLAGRIVKLHNIACPGHKQPQHAMTLQWILSQGWKPDAVVVLDGYNELAISAENAAAGVNPLFPSWLEMQFRLGSSTLDSEDLSLLGRAAAARDEAEDLREGLRSSVQMQSAILGTWHVGRVEAAVRRARLRMIDIQDHERVKVLAGKPLTIGGGSFDSDPVAVQEEEIEAWRECSLDMQAVCRARGIAYLHVLQPSASDADSKPLTPEEAEGAKLPPVWAEAVARGYPRLREVGGQLAREGVGFFDASRIFVGHPERIYKDACHFASEGCSVLGPAVAQALLRVWKE